MISIIIYIYKNILVNMIYSLHRLYKCCIDAVIMTEYAMD